MKATRIKLIAGGSLLAFALVAFGLYYHALWPSDDYSVSYGSDGSAYTDGALFRPIDIRIAGQLLSGKRIYCVRVPRWGHYLVVDFDQQMFYLPNMPPDTHGLNRYLGVALPDEKIGSGWVVDFSRGSALCYSAAGEWCLLTPGT